MMLKCPEFERERGNVCVLGKPKQDNNGDK